MTNPLSDFERNKALGLLTDNNDPFSFRKDMSSGAATGRFTHDGGNIEEVEKGKRSMTFDPADEFFLGDGLYASFDGFQFKLRAPRSDRNDDVVFLEPLVMLAFTAYAKRVEEFVSAQRKEANRVSRG